MTHSSPFLVIIEEEWLIQRSHLFINEHNHILCEVKKERACVCRGWDRFSTGQDV